MSSSVSVASHVSEKRLFNLQLAKYRGSVSAEHGIGSMKTHALPYTKDAVSIGLMKRIKNLFDPNGIMNPGKVLE